MKEQTLIELEQEEKNETDEKRRDEIRSAMDKHGIDIVLLDAFIGYTGAKTQFRDFGRENVDYDSEFY